MGDKAEGKGWRITHELERCRQQLLKRGPIRRETSVFKGKPALWSPRRRFFVSLTSNNSRLFSSACRLHRRLCAHFDWLAHRLDAREHAIYEID